MSRQAAILIPTNHSRMGAHARKRAHRRVRRRLVRNARGHQQAGYTETYVYDNLQRLSSATRTGTTVSYGYSPSGSLTSKPDYGRHAARSVCLARPLQID